MADVEVEPERRKCFRAKSFLSHGKGTGEEGDNMVIGGKSSAETVKSSTAPGEGLNPLPGTSSGASGLQPTNEPGKRQGKRNATTPIANLLKQIRTYVSPRQRNKK